VTYTHYSRPRHRRGNGLLAFLGVLVIAAALLALQSAVVMILLAGAHDLDSRVPAFGFWTTLILILVANTATEARVSRK
jgi:hypothetical protein